MSHKVGSHGEEGGCLFQTALTGVEGFPREQKGKLKLSGNSKTRTFTGYPSYSCGLILQKTASETGREADGAARRTDGSSSSPRGSQDGSGPCSKTLFTSQ